MIERKIYLYDSSQEQNGYRGADFSAHILQGNEETEDITQELDTAEITLCGLNIQKEFAPETKFILDVWENGEIIESKTKHFCVARDIVNQPILSDDTYFDHHISFIEPSVIAQKRLVDNIATTYKLKDVTLKEVPSFPDTQVSFYIQPSAFVPEINFGETRVDNSTSAATFITSTFLSGKYFQLEDRLMIESPNGVLYDNIYNNIEDFRVGQEYRATFVVPKMAIMFGNNGSKTFSKLGYASISCKVEELDLNNEQNISNQWTANFISNSNLGEDTYSTVNGWQNRILGEWLLEECRAVNQSGTTIDTLETYYKKYTETTAVAPTYRIENIPIRTDKRYRVSISLYQFEDNIPNISNRRYKKFTGSQPNYYVKTENTILQSGANVYITEKPSSRPFISSQTSGNASFYTYSVDTGELVYSSATPYSALALLQKAIINSSLYEKQDGVYIADVNNSNLPFYIDDNFVDDLAATTIIENFYNQKNLWEIMIDVGHYIHSIPELKFGSNDRFLITFNKLGRTDEKENLSNKVSIFNSRSVESYISATSSYVENMVQLGGIIEEWVAPKTTNEQLLVTNDTAEIIVSKPIIELIQVLVRDNTDLLKPLADLTPFIYEENVYKTLGLDYAVDPNRGIAMYYKLGTNVITGGQYQLPQANTNPFTDYTFKKVIWSAFNGYATAVGNPTQNYWESIDVNNYSFFVVYRTKDSVRQNHIRPDIRKYLLNSQFDRFPEHNQFNNQTDVVVDSIKFGNNVYGKLIKTGNSSYDITEWNESVSNLKHKGELYRINGELYYVAKATHIFFSSHIISTITYSKDYNELSAIIGIPSEPRFYEISEQSLIWREFAINDILLLTDNKEQLSYGTNYVFNYEHLAKLLLADGTDFARYAITVYKGDKDVGNYDQTIGQPTLYKEVVNPINAYSSENTLTYEWDMIDNYSAGDKVIETTKEKYNSLRAVPYTDIYGKAALMDFYILGDIESVSLSPINIREMPESPINTRRDVADGRVFIGNLDILGTNVKQYNDNFNGRGIGLLKDCREAMSINFNLQLATNSDTFVLSPYTFLPNKKNLRVVLLSEEVNKLSGGYIDNSLIITPIGTNGETLNPYFEFEIDKETTENSWDNTKQVWENFGIDLETLLSSVSANHFSNTQGYQRVKSIAVLCDVAINPSGDSLATSLPYKTQFVFARNIPEDWGKDRATSPIYFGSPNKSTLFTNKQ